MSIADKNSFDNLSNHSGEPSPARGGAQLDGDDMQIDDMSVSASDSDGESPARLTAAQKAKGKAPRIRTASEAGLSPPPAPSRPFATGGDEGLLKDGQNVPYPDYRILDDGYTDEEEEETASNGGGGGFMADARKATNKTYQTPADIERDFLMAAAIQKEEARRQEAARKKAMNFAAAVQGGGAPEPTGATASAVPASSGGQASQNRRNAATPAPGASSAAPGPSSGPSSSRHGGPTARGATPAAAPKNVWKLFKYKGGVTAEDLLIALKDGVEIRFWPPSFPHPKGVTFNTLTLFLDDDNREGFRTLEGNVLIAWPADIGRADVDALVHTIRTVCAILFNDPAAVKVFPADRNGDLQAPIALIKCTSRDHYVFLRDQVVINNSMGPFFVISRRRLPARITHTVTGGGWENNAEGRDALETLYREAAAKSDEIGDFANENHDAVDRRLNVTDFHKYLAESITADPLDVYKKGTQTPAVNWRIECARMTCDEDKVRELNSLIKNLRVRHKVYGTPQVIRAPKCGMCGCVYHPFGKCEIAGHPSWLGPKVKTGATAKIDAAPAPEEDETLPNGNMRLTAARLKDTPGANRGKSDKKGKGKGKK